MNMPSVKESRSAGSLTPALEEWTAGWENLPNLLGILICGGATVSGRRHAIRGSAVPCRCLHRLVAVGGAIGGAGIVQAPALGWPWGRWGWAWRRRTDRRRRGRGSHDCIARTLVSQIAQGTQPLAWEGFPHSLHKSLELLWYQ